MDFRGKPILFFFSRRGWLSGGSFENALFSFFGGTYPVFQVAICTITIPSLSPRLSWPVMTIGILVRIHAYFLSRDSNTWEGWSMRLHKKWSRGIQSIAYVSKRRTDHDPSGQSIICHLWTWSLRHSWFLGLCSQLPSLQRWTPSTWSSTKMLVILWPAVTSFCFLGPARSYKSFYWWFGRIIVLPTCGSFYTKYWFVGIQIVSTCFANDWFVRVRSSVRIHVPSNANHSALAEFSPVWLIVVAATDI